MKIKNPDYVDPVAVLVTANKAAFRAVFKSRLTDSHLTFEELRAALPPGLADKLTDGVIDEICKSLGLEIVG